MKKEIIIKKESNRFLVIDFLKGISIFGIVLMHLFSTFQLSNIGIINKALLLLGTGVHIFIFCSGFGLNLSQNNRKLNYLEFLKRRFFIIYVPYILSLLLYFIYFAFFKEEKVLMEFLSHIFLFKMFVPSLEDSFGIQFWYISTLFQLYFLFIPIYKFKEKYKLKAVIVCFIISVLYWTLLATTGLYRIRVLGSAFLTYLWEFVIGMYVSDILCKKELHIKNSRLLKLSTISILIGGGYNFIWWKVFNEL